MESLIWVTRLLAVSPTTPARKASDDAARASFAQTQLEQLRRPQLRDDPCRHDATRGRRGELTNVPLTNKVPERLMLGR
jgi:hypothetical protein